MDTAMDQPDEPDIRPALKPLRESAAGPKALRVSLCKALLTELRRSLRRS